MRIPFQLRLGVFAVALSLAGLVAAVDRTNPSVGKAAPEISGTDVDGKALKLSDYKGKVVLVDFWGDW